MTTALDVLRFVAGHPHAMQVLGGDACVIQHVSVRNPDGPDERLDGCPCDRGLETLDGEPPQLGGGQYVSSGRHTYADVVRDVVGGSGP